MDYDICQLLSSVRIFSDILCMNNTADIFEAHFPRVKKVHVVIEYGKPIYPKELDKETRKHLGIYCHDLIQDTIKKNASLI